MIKIDDNVPLPTDAENFKAEAIQRGLAQYCPVTGNWAWKGECK